MRIFNYLLLLFLVSCVGQNTSHLMEGNVRGSADKVSFVSYPWRGSLLEPNFISGKSDTSSFGPNNFVRTMTKDKEGNVWFGTWNNGIFKYDGKLFTHFTDEGLRSEVVVSMLADRNGNMWFGTWQNGVYRYDGLVFTHFTVENGLADNYVHCILEDEHGGIWFGTDKGLSRYEVGDESIGKGCIPQKGFSHVGANVGLERGVYCMLIDANKCIWLGSGKGVFYFDGGHLMSLERENGVAFNDVRSMIIDKAGDLWIGSRDGVSKYDGKGFVHYTEKDGIGGSFVWSLLEDKEGIIWLGVCDGFGSGRGMCRFDGKEFVHYTRQDGLLDNRVFCMLEDRKGRIWFGTSGGGCVYDGKKFLTFIGKNGPGGC